MVLVMLSSSFTQYQFFSSVPSYLVSLSLTFMNSSSVKMCEVILIMIVMLK